MVEANSMLVPRWAVDEILLSPDLLVCIMASLPLDDGAVAAVSKVWAESWATLLALRRLVFRSRPSRLQITEPAHSRFTRRLEPTARWLRRAFPGPWWSTEKAFWTRSSRLQPKAEALGSIGYKSRVEVDDGSTGGIRVEAISRPRTAG